MQTSSRYRHYYRYYLLSIILIGIAASRIFRLLSPGIIDDEVWSVCQTLGSPPLFYLLMGVWRGFVAMLPVADRFLSALLFLLACVGVYRLVRRLSTETAALFLFYWQRRNRLTFALLVWLSLVIVLYLARSIIGSFFSARFVWWELMPFAIWIGWGLSHITKFKGHFPRIIVTGIAVLMLAASALPVPTLIADNTRTPLMDAYDFLKTHMQRYDVILIDPKCICASPMEWDYYTQAYFPEGMQFISDPSGYRRIWYVTGSSSLAADIEAAVTTTRSLRESIGPSKLRFRLYEAPPNTEGILFDNGMRFHCAEFVSPDPGMMVLHEGEPFRIRLWWTVDRPIGAQFSIGLYLMNKGRVAAQSDGPQESDTVPKYTDQWKPGPGNFYVEERDMQIPNLFTTGTYPLYIAVYQSWDGTRLSAPGADANKLLLVEQLSIKSWSIVP